MKPGTITIGARSGAVASCGNWSSSSSDEMPVDPTDSLKAVGRDAVVLLESMLEAPGVECGRTGMLCRDMCAAGELLVLPVCDWPLLLARLVHGRTAVKLQPGAGTCMHMQPEHSA